MRDEKRCDRTKKWIFVKLYVVGRKKVWSDDKWFIVTSFVVGRKKGVIGQKNGLLWRHLWSDIKKGGIERKNGELWRHLWSDVKKVWCVFPPFPGVILNTSRRTRRCLCSPCFHPQRHNPGASCSPPPRWMDGRRWDCLNYL